MSSPPLRADRVVLDTELAFSQIGDIDAMRDMLGLLEEALVRDLPEIASMVAQGDQVGANRLLHALKGFIPIFCQQALSDEVAMVEGLSKTPDNTALMQGYAALRPQLEQLRTEVSAYLMESGKAG